MLDIRAQTFASLRGKVAELGNGFRGAFGGDNIFTFGRSPPHLRHRQQAGLQWKPKGKRPIAMKMLGLLEKPGAQITARLLHRVIGIRAARQDRVFDKPVIGLREVGPNSGRDRKALAIDLQLGDSHAVERQGAGLVRAEDGDRAERFHRRRSAGQHFALRHTPRAHDHENRQHERKFFRQCRHRQGDARQDPL